MEFISITAIDKHSSDTAGRTFPTKDSKVLKSLIEAWETELSFNKYELVCNELSNDYSTEVLGVLEELEVDI